MSDFIFAPTPPRSIAGIATTRDPAPLHAALLTHFAVTLPTTPSTIQSGPITWSCVSPSRFLAAADRAASLPIRLTQLLKDLAAVTDQSDMWSTYTLSGTATRDALSRIVPIDLYPGSFPIGALACTRAAHLDVRLTRIAHDIYELAVTRSYTADLEHALDSAFHGIQTELAAPPHHHPI